MITAVYFMFMGLGIVLGVFSTLTWQVLKEGKDLEFGELGKSNKDLEEEFNKVYKDTLHEVLHEVAMNTPSLSSIEE